MFVQTAKIWIALKVQVDNNPCLLKCTLLFGIVICAKTFDHLDSIAQPSTAEITLISFDTLMYRYIYNNTPL